MPNVNMEAGGSTSNLFENSLILEETSLLSQIFNNKEELYEENQLLCKEYLQKLSSFGISKLASEPAYLQEEHTNIKHQTQTLAYENYSTFIQAAECSKEIYKDKHNFSPGNKQDSDFYYKFRLPAFKFNIVEDHLDSVEGNLPKFVDVISSFSKTSQEINACRKQNSLVLSRHTHLLEILEISQLMDTCVRNSYYEEALELSNYVRRLERKFSQIKIITDIATEVKKSTQYMLNQLVQQLKSSIQLPACLRIISYIRQLEVFTEAELRIKFLEGRDAWFQSVLSQLPRDDTYTHLTKVIDASRVSLFDIITQYNAIFSDNEPLFITGEEKKQNTSSILHSWVLLKLSQFISTLDEGINKGLHGRLDSLYGQCMYFGLSFSRIGADFRGLIVSLFCKHALDLFRCRIKQTTQNFEDDMSAFSSRSMKHEHLSGSHIKKDEDPCIPPHELLEFPPVALYVNGVLSAFNEFRQLPSLSLVFQLKKCLDSSLDKVMSSVENWARLESKSNPTDQSQEVNKLCHLVCRHFLPYIQVVFSNVFNMNDIQEMMGRTPHGVTGAQFNAMFTLDVEQLHKHLKDFVDLHSIINELENINKIGDDKSTEETLLVNGEEKSVELNPETISNDLT